MNMISKFVQSSEKRVEEKPGKMKKSEGFEKSRSTIKRKERSPSRAVAPTKSCGVGQTKKIGLKDIEKSRRRPVATEKSAFEAEIKASLRSDSEKFNINHAKAPEPGKLQRQKLPQTDENFFKPRQERQKVFAGRRKVQIKMHSLLQLSQIALGHNLTAIGNVGLCPYSLIKPILEKRTVVELRSFLSCNPGLEEDSDELFEKFVKRHPLCSSVLIKEEKSFGFWRRKYIELCKLAEKQKCREEARLQILVDKHSIKAKKMDTGRKAIVIEEALAPRNSRRQNNFGTVSRRMTTPTAKDISMARRAVAAGDKTKLSALPQAFVYNSVNPGKLNAKQKSTNAPLMKKTMMMMKLMRR